MKTFEFTQEQIKMLIDCIDAQMEDNMKIIRNTKMHHSTRLEFQRANGCLLTLLNYLSA